MNTFAKVDRETFLRFAAEHSEQRYELERGRIVQQMTGGTQRHGLIARRIARMIEDQIDGAAWIVLTDRGVSVGESARYPDVVVEPATEGGDSLATELPSIIVEVLSPSTTATDLNTKPVEYLAIETLDAYIVASQDEPAMMIWTRGPDGRFDKLGREVSGATASVVIMGRNVAFKLELTAIYRGLVG